MIKHFFRLTLVLFSLCAGTHVCAQTLTAEDVLDGLNTSSEERARLRNGEVLAFDGEQYERTERELSADALIIVESPLDEIAEQLVGVATIIPEKYVVDHGEVKSASDLDAVAYTNEDYEEVELLLKARPGKHFNFSSDEFKKLSEFQKTARGMDRAGQIEAASVFMRGVLINRFLSYQASGLAGIDGYWRSKRKTISIGDELRMTSQTLDPLEGEFDTHYQLLLNYPENTECCEHIFRWLKFDLRDRPTFSLSHSIIEKTETHLLFTERHYFVSSTLNSTQISLAWIPFEEGTYMGLAISASTDVLDSFMGRILRPLGRNKARDLVTDTLTDIRTSLGEDPKEDGN